MREDEIIYEGSEFASHYEELEEQGIYWLLCELQKLIRILNSEITREDREEIQSLPIGQVSNRSDRHDRDYDVLELLNGLLHRMVVKFQLLDEGRHMSSF